MKDNEIKIRIEEKKKSIKNKFRMYDKFATTEHLSILYRKHKNGDTLNELHGKRTRTARVTVGSHGIFYSFLMAKRKHIGRNEWNDSEKAKRATLVQSTDHSKKEEEEK